EVPMGRRKAPPSTPAASTTPASASPSGTPTPSTPSPAPVAPRPRRPRQPQPQVLRPSAPPPARLLLVCGQRPERERLAMRLLSPEGDFEARCTGCASLAAARDAAAASAFDV